MRILLLVKNFDYGGAENHVRDLANELVRSGHQVWLMSGKGRQSGKLDKRVTQLDGRFYEWNFILLLIKLFLLVRRESIEVIHAHQRLPILMAALTGNLCNVPTVATVHGDSRHDLRGNYVKRNLSSIIFINEKVFNTYTESFLIGNKIHYIPNGILLPGQSTLAENKGRHLSEENVSSSNKVLLYNPLKILYISRIDKRHGQVITEIISKVLPEVKKEFPEVMFYIVGEGEGLEKIKIMLSSDDYTEIRDSVVCENYSDNVYKFYLDADLVLGVGRVAAESLVNGVPLLSVKNNHLGEIITRGNFEKMRFTNFVAIDSPPFTPDKAAELIIDFCHRRSYFKEEAIFLQKIISEDQNINVVTNKITDIYSKISRQNKKDVVKLTV
ncbi:MAG: glycosyltransferase [Bacteroidales bacterium]|nr:glycosyltransferase [Bacteroidales bacterium]MDD2425176.1 glycosyltransferase [Bacteroidales bacterium]MDD3989577.1 glycosyltransferase [Bacteroidales bacterium]